MRQFTTYKPVTIENILTRGKEREINPLSATDVKTIKAYLAKKKSGEGKGISPGTEKNIASKLTNFREFLSVEYGKAKHEDLSKAFDGMKNAKITIKVGGKKEEKPRYKENTISNTKEIIKTFYFYLIDEGKTKITITELKNIKKVVHESTITHAQLLTHEEIERMIAATTNPMYRALIAVLADSGARIHEIGGMKWGDLDFQPAGVRWSLFSKKTGNRHVFLNASRPHLVRWQGISPKTGANDPVFIYKNGKPLIYETTRRIINRIVVAAGIEKHVHPHLFRHGKVTEMLDHGVHESVLKKTIWGKTSSKMLDRYEHLSSESIDKEIMRAFGLDAAPAVKVTQIICPGCGSMNPETAKICHSCGVNMQALEAGQSEVERLKRSVESQQVIINKLIERLDDISTGKFVVEKPSLL